MHYMLETSDFGHLSQLHHWYLLERENVPSLSPAMLSAPHCNTTAEGWKQETTWHEEGNLQYCMLMLCQNLIEHLAKQLCVSLVSDSLQQRDINRVTQTHALSNFLIRPCAWRKLLMGDF